MAEELPDVGEFGARFDDFMRAMVEVAQRRESALAARLREHLGVDPRELPTTVTEFSVTEHPNLQLALDAVLGDAELIGFTSRHAGMMAIGLNELLAGQAMTGPVTVGPVQYTNVEVGDGRAVQCVSSGLYLAKRAGKPVALVLSRAGRQPPFGQSVLKLEGVSPDGETLQALLEELRAAMLEHDVYRGKVISLHELPDRSVTIQFHSPAAVERDAVILPPGALERLERHALGIAAQAEALQKDGRHLKRGVLMHGPPGTGKTLSVNYLLAASPGRTTVLLTGQGLGLIEEALRIARQLVPATVVLEDIDLVAAERTMHVGHHGALFDLLNQMEGLDDDADLLFLLTTNRPDIVEPALAARPGRIDLALELPLPDDDARRRLLRLYAHGITLDESAEHDVVTRTEGVSGAFIKELMRQASLRAVLDGRAIADATDVIAALDELLEERSALTRRLLGQPADGGAAAATAAGPPLAPMLRAFAAAGLPVPPGIDQD